MAVQRFGIGRLDRVTGTPQGGLRVDATPTRVGVFTYRTSDGVRRELRPPEEVFAARSLATLFGAPVTALHPDEGEVNPANYSRLARGHVAEAARPSSDGMHVETSLFVQDAALVSAVQSGEYKELSCGYMADLDDTPGVWNGEPYDCVQRNIVYNHVAAGPPGWGRQGGTVAMRLDGGAGWQVDSKQLEPAPKKEPTMALRIDGKDYDPASAECQAAIAAVCAARDTAMGRADAAETLAKTEKARADAAVEPKALHARVVARQKMLDGVNRIMRAKGATLDAEEAASSSADALILKAIQTWNPSIDVNGKSPEYIAGVFDALLTSMVGGEAEAPVDGLTSEMPHDEGVLPPPPQTAPNRQDATREKIRKNATREDDIFATSNEIPRHERPLSASKDRVAS